MNPALPKEIRKGWMNPAPSKNSEDVGIIIIVEQEEGAG